jgi:hypothetical protein
MNHKHHKQTNKKEVKMAILKRQTDSAHLVRYSVSMKPETKALLDEYAYRSKQSLSLAFDTLTREAATAKLAEMDANAGGGDIKEGA